MRAWDFPVSEKPWLKRLQDGLDRLLVKSRFPERLAAVLDDTVPEDADDVVKRAAEMTLEVCISRSSIRAVEILARRRGWDTEEGP